MDWLDLGHHVGWAAILYAAIRADLRYLIATSKDHEKRIRELEREI